MCDGGSLRTMTVEEITNRPMFTTVIVQDALDAAYKRVGGYMFDFTQRV